MMDVVILVGGQGSRLRSVVPALPKPMAPIRGKPFLYYQFRYLASQGFKRLILSTGYKADMIESYFGAEFDGMELIYSNEDRPLGTGGGALQAVSKCNSESVIIMNGDTFVDLDFRNFMVKNSKDARAKIVTWCNSENTRYGSVQIVDGVFKSFSSEPSQACKSIYAGVMMTETDLLSSLLKPGRSSLEQDFIAKLPSETKVEVFEHNNFFIDIGVPEDYSRAQISIPNICDALRCL